jgi:hypothetical protein
MIGKTKIIPQYLEIASVKGTSFAIKKQSPKQGKATAKQALCLV